MRAFITAALCAAAVGAAGAQQVDHLVPFHSSTGMWEFGCRGGKLVAVRIVFIVPGEVMLMVPPNVCDKPAATPQGSAPAPLPAPSASANKRWKPA